jgi:hypothetical protein
VLQSEWVLLEMGFVGENFALRFFVGKYLQFWCGDFAHIGVAQ